MMSAFLYRTAARGPIPIFSGAGASPHRVHRHQVRSPTLASRAASAVVNNSGTIAARLLAFRPWAVDVVGASPRIGHPLPILGTLPKCSFHRRRVEQDGPASGAQTGNPPPPMPSVNRRGRHPQLFGQLSGVNQIAHVRMLHRNKWLLLWAS